MVTPDKMKLCASSLAALDGVRHGFFTRQGGVSSGIYASLNCGPGSRDAAANVAENRARVAELLGAEPGKLLTVFQKHSADAVIAETPWKGGKMPEADAIVTTTPGLAIGVLTADCAPVLFCDGTRGSSARRMPAGGARSRASSRPRSRPCGSSGRSPSASPR